jgi:hypothetical protein
MMSAVERSSVACLTRCRFSASSSSPFVVPWASMLRSLSADASRSSKRCAEYETYAASSLGWRRLRMLYRSVVLPVPTSPTSVTKPRPSRRPYCTAARASRWSGLK